MKAYYSGRLAGAIAEKTESRLDTYIFNISRFLDRKYDCEHCKHWKECNDGENCVKDKMREKNV